MYFSKTINVSNFFKNSDILDFLSLIVSLLKDNALASDNALKETTPPPPLFAINFIKKINNNFKFYNIQKGNEFIFIAFFIYGKCRNFLFWRFFCHKRRK
jgi:hypothetical protein